MAAQQNVVSPEFSQFLLMVVALTMAVTPLLSIFGVWYEDRFDEKEERDQNQEFMGISDLEGHVIVAGLGRVGRVVAYMLSQEQINYVAVEANVGLARKARQEGFQVYHGDIAQVDIARAVGVERAKAVVLTMSDKVTIRKAVRMLSAHYKSLEIITRVEDYKHGKSIRKLGATKAVPETIETGLQLGGASLTNLGIAEHEIISMKENIRRNEYLLIEEVELFKGVVPNNSKVEKSEEEKE
jgi:CPA2 family monovalent cation:H+ antiporter-2